MPEELTIPAATWEAVDSLATGFLEAKTAPGLAYAVVRHGQIQHGGGVGFAVLDGEAPDATTAFRIASMTKSFTAAAILMLRDQGVLGLDDPIDTYLSQLRSLELPTSDSRMPSIRDLLTMSAGWATDDPWADREESMSAADYDELLAGGFTFNFSPGTGFEYSNLGYTMLGRIITVVSGIQYQKFVTERILRPLEMRNTGFTSTDIGAAAVANGHFFRDGSWQIEPLADTGEFAPLGGLFSTCADLAIWVRLLSGAFPARNDTDDAPLLSRASLREMQQGQRVLAPSMAVATAGQPLWLSSAAYGFGLLSAEDPLRGTIIGHSGGYPGYGTHMCWHPASGIGVIALSNGRYGGAVRIATSMLRTVLDAANAPSRVIAITTATSHIRGVVDRVLDSWDDAAVDAVVAANVDQDIPRAHRRAEIAAAVAAVGSLAPASAEHDEGTSSLASSSESHLVWWRRGERGRLRVEIRLTPQRPQRLQTLNVRAVAQPSVTLAETVDALVAALNCPRGQMPSWPMDVAVDVGVDIAAALDMAVLARVLQPQDEFEIAVHPCAATDEHSATFELRRGRLVWELVLAVHADTGQVTSCALTQRPLTSDAYALVVTADEEK